MTVAGLGISLLGSRSGPLLLDLAARGQNHSFSTNEHGFAAYSCFVPLVTKDAFFIYDRPGLLHVRVGWQGWVIWEGRLEDVHVVKGGIDLAAFGYIRGYADVPYNVSHIGVTALTIVRALVASANASNSFMSASTALVQDPGVTLAEIYEDRYPLEILNRLCQLGDNQASPRIWEAAVWEERQLTFQPRGATGRQWFIDISEPDINRTLDALWNSVYATYQNGGGVRTLTGVSVDAGSVARYGLTRRAAVQVQTQLDPVATAVRGAYLADHKDPPSTRSGLVIRELYDKYGTRWPLFVARSGDAVTIRNLPPALSTDYDRLRTFRIKDTAYAEQPDSLNVVPEALQAGLDPTASAAWAIAVRDPNFQYDPRPTLAELYGVFQGLPGLRGLWYPGTVDDTGALYDVSGQGRKLTYTGNPTLNILNGFIPFWDYDGTGDYHTRASEAALNITGAETTIAAAVRGMTFCIWMNPTSFTNLVTGKYATAGNQRSWLLFSPAANTLGFIVDSLGTGAAGLQQANTPGTMVAGVWHFIVVRWKPSTEMAIFVDGVKYSITASIPATMFAGTSSFDIATDGGHATHANIRVALAALCATQLSDAQIDTMFQRTRRAFGV